MGLFQIFKKDDEEEGPGRRARSIKILKQHKVPYLESLPCIETKDQVRIRSAEEIARRAIPCLLTIQLACDMASGAANIDESKQFLMEQAARFGVQDCFTPREMKLFNGIADQQDVIDMAWKYESYWVLVWALGRIDFLRYPKGICDCQFAIFIVSSCSSYQEFLKRASLRSIDKILDEADLIYRYDWACVEARIHGKEAPGKLDSGVVLERHRALNWLIDSDGEDDWDNVSTDT